MPDIVPVARVVGLDHVESLEVGIASLVYERVMKTPQDWQECWISTTHAIGIYVC